MREYSETDRIGRIGELLAGNLYRGVGFASIDVAAAAIRGAPLIEHWETSIVAPDGIISRNAMFLHEIKTKRRADLSRGGSMGLSWIPHGQRFHGIDRANYLGYLRAQALFKRPCIITIVCIEDAEILAASLRQLGEPYPSLLPQLYDLVNFPIERFRRIWAFDPKRFPKLFNEQPEKLLPGRMRRIIEWLQPVQAEFDFLVADLIDECERQWGAS